MIASYIELIKKNCSLLESGANLASGKFTIYGSREESMMVQFIPNTPSLRHVRVVVSSIRSLSLSETHLGRQLEVTVTGHVTDALTAEAFLAKVKSVAGAAGPGPVGIEATALAPPSPPLAPAERKKPAATVAPAPPTTTPLTLIFDADRQGRDDRQQLYAFFKAQKKGQDLALRGNRQKIAEEKRRAKDERARTRLGNDAHAAGEEKERERKEEKKEPVGEGGKEVGGDRDKERDKGRGKDRDAGRGREEESEGGARVGKEPHRKKDKAEKKARGDMNDRAVGTSGMEQKIEETSDAKAGKGKRAKRRMDDDAALKASNKRKKSEGEDHTDGSGGKGGPNLPRKR